MKALKIFLFCFVFAKFASAQTADEIIQKYTVAMGGLDAINKIESAKLTGHLISQGKSFSLTIQIKNGKSMRTDVDVNGQVVTNAYDKGKGWKLNPFEGLPAATDVTNAEDLALLKVQASLANNLMDYKKRGHQVEYAGLENVDDIPAYKIKLTSKDDGRTTTYYISTKDNLLVRSDSKQKIQANEYDAQTFYSDIKVVNGLKFSMHFIRKVSGQVFQEVIYDKVELNPAMSDDIFKKPG